MFEKYVLFGDGGVFSVTQEGAEQVTGDSTEGRGSYRDTSSGCRGDGIPLSHSV